MLKVYETKPGEIVVSNGNYRVVINDDELNQERVQILAGGFSGRATLIHTTDKPMQVGEVYDATEIRPENLMVLMNESSGYVVQHIKQTVSPYLSYWLSMGDDQALDTLPPGKYKILHLGK